MTRTALFMTASRLLLAADDSLAAGAPAVEAPKAPEPKTVANDMDSRRTFPNVDEATAYLQKCAEELTDFAETPLAAAGMTEEGFDPAIYTDSMDVMVSVLTGGKGARTVKAIVVAPIPKIQSVIDSPEGLAWATRILHKEMNHVAVRPLRDAADVAIVIDQIPTTMSGYIESQRASAGMVESFNELYKPINQTMSKAPVWAKARLTKPEMKRAFESKAYAEEFYPAVENRGEGKDSLFVTALNIAVAAAKKKGLDPAIFAHWLSTRDQKALTQEDEGDDFDIAALADSMAAGPTPAAEPTTAA